MPNRSGVWNLNTVLQAKNATNWPTRPDAPTGVSAVAGNEQATVSFTPPSFQGIPATIIDYRATSTPDGITATASSSPITVTGLTNDTAYTFTVAARNELGYGAEGGPSGSVTPAVPQIALFSGGALSSFTSINTISSVTITATGNATDFGDLTQVTRQHASCSSATRGIFAGGNAPSSNTDVISYVTIASTGNASDFGDMTVALGSGPAGASNSTRGLIIGGTAAPRNTIQYITIASTGNATDFGDLTNLDGEFLAACASSTRAVFTGGNFGVIEYVTIASTGDSIDFGDTSIAEALNGRAGASNSTRGLFAGGEVGVERDIIEYITIASTGNATDFGDLTSGRSRLAGAAGESRALFAGGFTSYYSTWTDSIDFVTIASTGNASDFGDLISAVDGLAGCSSAHGGLA